MHKQFFVILMMSLLWGCGQPQIMAPDARGAIEDYLQALKIGDKKALKTLYFMPLSFWKNEKLYKRFEQRHNKIAAGLLSLAIKDYRQKGRWAVALLDAKEKLADGTLKSSLEPAWFFYYDGHWQYISPAIYKSGPVRNMMDLYREQEDLQKWVASQLIQNDSGTAVR